MVGPFCTESIWIGKMNYIPADSTLTKSLQPFYAEIRRNYEIEHLFHIYNDLRNFRKSDSKDSVTIKLKNCGLI